LAFIGWLVFYRMIVIGDPIWLNCLRLFFAICISASLGLSIGYSLVEMMKPRWEIENKQLLKLLTKLK